MTALPLDLYDDAITSHSRSDGCPSERWHVRYSDGRSLPLELRRWCNEPDAADIYLLNRCADPTLDVGCGPGRLVAALASSGRRALGVDLAAAAIRLTRSAGAEALRQSVFEPLPDEGGWGTVLLADGNIGIGGDPVALLRRCGELLAPGGRILVELDPPGSGSTSVRLRLETRHQQSSWFRWAHVAAETIGDPTRAAGLRVTGSWTRDGRWFACLAR